MKSEVQQKLDENIPKDVISTREQAGRKLSYLETWYIIDRLNQVLGQGNWGYQTSKLDKVFEGQVEQRSGSVFATSYVATVALFATIEGKTVIFTEVGYGDGTDKANPGKAHELATKEAVSDALKRAAKNLGRSMGLALYDKTQEFVGINNKTVSETGNKGPATNSDRQTAGTSQSNVSPASSLPQSEKPLVTAEEKTIKDRVHQAFKILEAQKKITKEEFKTKYQKGKGISGLTTDELSVILKQVKTDYPNLNVQGA